jgi:hypothetical protein
MDWNRAAFPHEIRRVNRSADYTDYTDFGLRVKSVY